MKIRSSWFAFPMSGFLGAALCFLQSPTESGTAAMVNGAKPQKALPLDDHARLVIAEDPSSGTAMDVAQALRQALLHTSRLHRRYELARLAERLTARELRVLLEEYLDQPYASRTDKLMLAEIWAERAPEEAAAFITDHPQNYLLSQAVARGWARHKPSAALAWVMGLPANRRLELLVQLQQGSLASKTPNPAEVMNAALESYEAGHPAVRGADLATLFEQWARHDFSAVEAFARELPEQQQRAGLMAVVTALGETDGPKAIEFLERMPVSNPWRTIAATKLASQLATQDVALATRFAHAQPEGRARASAIASVATVLLDSEPKEALALIDSVPITESSGTYSFYKELIKSDPGTALADYAQRLARMDPASGVYREFKGLFLNQLLTVSPPYETAEFLSGVTNSEQQSRLSSVVERWIRQDSVGAAAWVEALPGGAVREFAFTGMAGGKAVQNIPETVNWLGTLPRGSNYSAAVQGFAASVFSKDPDGAFAWLRTVPDPVERQRRLKAAWEYWAVSRSQKADRVAAEQWRDSSPDLTAEERNALVLP